MKKLSIPVISDEELMRRYSKIKPITDINGKKYWLRNYSIDEMRNTSFFCTRVTDISISVGEALSNHTHYDFQCLHTFGYHGFFKPSVAEVLSQIPQNLYENYSIDAFEIIDMPTNINDLNKFWNETKQGFHFSVVRLYIRVNSCNDKPKSSFGMAN